MNRRDFITLSGLAAGMVCTGGLLQACSSQKYISDYKVDGKKLIIKKTDFTFIKKEKRIQRKFVLIKPENTSFPIVVYQVGEAEYTALLLQCSHQGCELTAYETMLVCPCHGAEFNKKGEVTQGPADTNLKFFTTTNDDENIYIQL